MEIFDVVDENGEPTGETVERSVAHRDGIAHHGSHVWILRERAGRYELLLQKRSVDKDSHPGCYDISSAGHIPAGCDYVTSALRELYEELGLTATPEELEYCGQIRVNYQTSFHGKPFHDNEIDNVYLLRRDVRDEELRLQAEEVESVRWMELEDCVRGVREHSFPNCIYIRDLELIKAALAKETR